MQPTPLGPYLSEPPTPIRPVETDSLFEQLKQFPPEDKVYFLGRLLRDLFGDSPEGEFTIYQRFGTPYMHLLSPGSLARLILTPERIAQWQTQDFVDPQAYEELRACMNAGDEEKVRAWLEAHRP